MKLQSYVAGQWREGEGDGVTLHDAVTGGSLCNVSSVGLSNSNMISVILLA